MSWARDEWPSERARLMAAAMQPIEAEAAETTELEMWLKEDLSCQARHTRERYGKCSVEVTHLVTDCTGQFFSCDTAASYVRLALSTGGVCMGCKGMVEDHWRIVPI